jgi:hypothetical protein
LTSQFAARKARISAAQAAVLEAKTAKATVKPRRKSSKAVAD